MLRQFLHLCLWLANSTLALHATLCSVAVAKHLRGFGRSLYPRLQGDKVWTLQTAYNLRKFLHLYREAELEELNNLGIIGII